MQSRSLLLRLVAVAMLWGCSPGGEAGVTLKFWALGREGEAVRQMIPAFERSHPGIRVEVQQIPWSAAHEKLLTAYVGRALPDLFQAGFTWLPELVALGAVAPLDERLEADGTLTGDYFFAGARRANEIAGITYGVPWYVDTRVLFYRSDLLEAAAAPAPPWTWSSWLAALDLVQADLAEGRHALLLPFDEWEPVVILALQSGAELLREGERYGNFRSAAFRRAFAFYVDLFRRGVTASVSAAQIGNLQQEFGRGRFAFFVSGPWNLGELRRRLPAEMRDRWSTAPMPAPADASPGVSLVGGSSLAIARGSRHPGAAWKLIRHLLQPQAQIELHELAGDLPAVETAWLRSGLAENAPTRAFWLQLRQVRAAPRVPEWERIAQRIADACEAAVRGDQTVDEALAALDADVDRILEKRRWLLEREARKEPLHERSASIPRVIPAKAGIQEPAPPPAWIPALAGMTVRPKRRFLQGARGDTR